MDFSNTLLTLTQRAKQLGLQPDATLRFGNGKVTTFLHSDEIRCAVMYTGLSAETLIEAIKFFNMGFKNETRLSINEAVYKSIGNAFTDDSIDTHIQGKEVVVRIITNRRKTLFGSKLDMLIIAAPLVNSGALYPAKISNGSLLI